MRRRPARIAVTALLAAFFGTFLAAPVHAGGPPRDPRVGQALDLLEWTVQDLVIPAEPGAPFQFSVRLGNRVIDVPLQPASVRAPGFRLMVHDDQGLREIPAPAENTYRSTFEFNGPARAGASIEPAGLRAVIVGGDDQAWYIQPLAEAIPGAPRTAHVVYREQDRAHVEGTCAVLDVAGAAARLTPHAHAGGPDQPLVCEIACDADYDFFALNGLNTTSTTNDIQAVVNGVSTIYGNDVNVIFQITQIIIRTSTATNPYTTSNAPDLLNQMTSTWQFSHGAVPRDIAHLFTGRNLSGSTIGIAWLNGVCSYGNGYGLVQSRYTSNMAYRVALSAHELGHNFSAPHCNSSCNPCTIMCSGLGGCSGIITTFDTCTRSIISNYANSRPCLTPLPPPVLSLPFNETFPTVQLDPDKWQNNSGAGVTSLPINPPSPPNALLFIQNASIETKNLNTAAPNRPIFVAFRLQHRGVEAGKTFTARYFNEFLNGFNTLGVVTSNGIDQDRYLHKEYKLPFDGLSNTKGRIRFEAAGTEFDDFWYLDNVNISIYCRADINRDGVLNLADFGAFQTAFAINDILVADYNDDGVLNLADFGAFQTAFALGCY